MAENQTVDDDPEFAAADHPPSFDTEEMPQGSEGGHSSSADSDSDDSEDEALDIRTLERAVQDSPNDYDAQVKYIKSLRKAGEIEKLRAARESMSALFPLTPTMWQEWASDESSLSTSPEALTTVKNIYERGVQEYLSIPLWCNYLNFIQEYNESVSTLTIDGVAKMRDLFEQALTSGGLHIAEGSKIWDAYREFEQAYHLAIDEADAEEKARQTDRIRSLFHRQLSIPLANMSFTLDEYKQWEIGQGKLDGMTTDFDSIPSNVMSAYKKALGMYNSRASYEERVSGPDVLETEKLQGFMSYIKFEERSGDPARTQVLYERAITEFPVSSDLWLNYTSYVDNKLKVPNVIKAVYTRATRSCPWIGELWTRYLLSLERLGSSGEDLSLVFEQALQCSFSSFGEYLDIFLTRIDGLRRELSTTSATSDDQNYDTIRKTFQRASEYFSPHLKGTDEFLHLHAYWARLEVELAKDPVAARGVWESLIKLSGSLLEVWQGYIAMEIGLKNIHEARSIYKRCYSKRFSGSGSKDICTSWLRFEREYGTLEDFDHAMKKVTPRLEELQLFQIQQEAKHQNHPSLESVERKGENLANNTSKKRKTDRGFSAMHPEAKRQKQISDGKPKSMSKQGRGFVGTSEHSSELVRPTSANEGSDEEKPREDSKPSLYIDQCTAFISNLSLDVTEEHLHNFFSEMGGVTAIRLLRDKFTGKSRGLAYVDFTDNEHLEAGIKQNRQKLLGKKVSIARSDPKQSKRSSGSGTSRGRGGRASDGRHEGRRENLSEASRQVSSVSHRRAGHVQLKGNTTFALPRSISRPLGWGTGSSKNEDGEDKPKSNDEFRKMFLSS
ncbi:uncharacterized protein LOC116263234 [Nymphaea colorata]|nr:uncharacterized protein LOC116263234 [Nymphaea colorata]